MAILTDALDLSKPVGLGWKRSAGAARNQVRHRAPTPPS
jgi:hypothetical protein